MGSGVGSGVATAVGPGVAAAVASVVADVVGAAGVLPEPASVQPLLVDAHSYTSSLPKQY